MLDYGLELFSVACESFSCIDNPEPLDRQTAQSRNEIKSLGIALSRDVVSVEYHAVVYIQDSVDRFALSY